jgi:hypothetical protein
VPDDLPDVDAREDDAAPQAPDHHARNALRTMGLDLERAAFRTEATESMTARIER